MGISSVQRAERNAQSTAKTLRISYIGMATQEVAIKPRLSITLKSDSEALDEVLVVAYGTTKKSSFTGAASTIKMDKIEARQVSSATQALSGAPGIIVQSYNGQPGTDPTIRIRGIGSQAAGNTPLYIVDGIPYDGRIADINPSDIESMSVLKDASASAIYGARGANGVVIISTKKGNGNRDAKVTLDAKWGTNKRAVPNYKVISDPATYLETYYASVYNATYYNANTGGDANAAWVAGNEAVDTYKIYTVPTGESLIGTDGKINPNATLGYSDGEYYYTPDNWYDEIFGGNNLRQEYNLGISGATDKMNFYMSLGYLDDSGIIPNSAFERYAARLKADYQAKKWLQVGMNIGFTHTKTQAPGSQTSWGSSGNLFYTADNIACIYPLYVRNADGTIARDEKGNVIYDNGTSSTNQTRSGGVLGNPMNDLIYNTYNRVRDAISASGFAKADIIEGLQFTANLSVNATNQRRNDATSKEYGSGASSGGTVELMHDRTFALNQQYLLTYNKTFGKHNIEALAGYESYNYKMQNIDAQKKMLYLEGVAELSNAILSGGSLPSSYTDTYTTRGFLTRVQYDYDGKYFASASYRRDASSRFSPDNRWGNFGSIGAAWLITKEDFMSDTSSWLDMLKFKISLGWQGNDNLLYPSTSAYYGEPNYHPWQDQYILSESNGNFAFKLDYKGNEDITWETSLSFNTGFDFALFKNRLSGTLEYYSRKTSDMLYNMPVAASKGYSSYPKNVGTMVNKGFELDLSGVIYENKHISVEANFNITTLHNEITSLDPSVSSDGVIGSWSIMRVGGSLYQAYLKKWAGVDPANGDALWYCDVTDSDGNVTGQTTTNDYSEATSYDCGDTLADLFGGFGFNVSAYGFDLSTQFAYQLGGRMYDYTYERMMASDCGSSNQAWHSDILRAWTEANPYTDVPRVDNSVDDGQYSSDRFLASSDYLSLNNITFGYTLPKKWLRSLKIDKLRVYVAGDNLWMLYKRKGLDPRTSIGGTNSYQYANTYSAIKTLSAGVSLTF